MSKKYTEEEYKIFKKLQYIFLCDDAEYYLENELESFYNATEEQIAEACKQYAEDMVEDYCNANEEEIAPRYLWQDIAQDYAFKYAKENNIHGYEPIEEKRKQTEEDFFKFFEAQKEN